MFNSVLFRNGRWRGVWTCKFVPGSGAVEVTGKLKVNVHYYEDGNVQLTTETPKAINVTGGGSVSLPFCERFFVVVVNNSASLGCQEYG